MRSHLCKWPWRDWQPLYRIGCKCLIVCVGIGDLCVVSYWIDTLVLKLREILTLLCCITLSSSREKQTQAQEVAGRIYGTVAGEIYTPSQVKICLPSTCQFLAPLPRRFMPCQVKICLSSTCQFLASLPGRSMPSHAIPSTHHELSSLALHYSPFASPFPPPHF